MIRLVPTFWHLAVHQQQPRDEHSARGSGDIPCGLPLVEALEQRRLLSFSVTPTVETDPVPHSGDAADDPAIWVHPTDVSQSAIIGSDKDGGIGVYDLSGNELQYVSIAEINNVDLRHGIPLGGGTADIVVGSNRTSNVLEVYKMNPATRRLENVAARALTSNLNEIYGLALYRSPFTGKFYAYTSDRDDGRVEQWELFDNGSGRIDGRIVRTFDAGGTVEGMVADDETGDLYVGEETGGLWKYGAEPTAGTSRTLIDTTDSGGRLTADLEGLAIYYAANGDGYLLASNQGANEFMIYNRDGNNEFVEDFTVVSGAIDGVNDTDGIDVLSFGLGSLFPEGVFVVQDGSNSGGNQNFKLVDWGDIARAASPDLIIDTSQDPRGGGTQVEAPAAPSGLEAAAFSWSRVDLGWTDNSDNESGFRIERSSNGGSTWSSVATVAAGVTSYSDTTVAGSTTYAYRVVAFNGGGSSDPSNVATVTTPQEQPTNPVTFISDSATWRYLDNGSNQGTTWRGRTFDDSAWSSGPAQLGYGDGDEATVVASGGSPVHITTYFRNTFNVTDPSAVTELSLQLLRDDGAVVYLNGTEIARSNMPSGTISSSTLASSAVGGTDESAWHTFTVDPSLLVAGANVLAVEIHQANSSSSDVSFNASLSGRQIGDVQQPTPPAAPTSLAAGAVTADQVDLTWSDNSSVEDGQRVERSTDGGATWSTVATLAANVESYSDTSVAPETTYDYRVIAFNAGGDSAPSNVVTVRTLASDPVVTVPAAPTGLSASAVASDRVNLAWTDNSTNETGFRIQRSTNGGSTWSNLASLAAGVTSYADTTVAPSTAYAYRVFAFNGAGDSPASNTATATTPAAEEPPTSGDFIAAGSVWRYLDNGSDQGTAWRATSFDDSAWSSGPAQLGYGDGDEATVVSNGGAAITTYFRRSFSVSDPASVTSLTLQLLRDDGAVVYLNGQEVVRSNMPTGTITSTTRASNVIGGSNEDAWHTFAINPALLVSGTNVIAVELHQERSNSSDISFDLALTGLRSGGQTQTPAAPTALSAAAPTGNQVNLTWTDNSSVETGHRIERSADAGATWTTLASVGANVESYSDTTVAPGTTYAYRVFAVNGTVSSSPSNVATVTTPAPTPSGDLVARGSTWRYLDNGSDQGTAWRALGFNDSSWASGPAQLGYGDGDEATVVTRGSGSSAFITTYFRHAFNFSDPAAIEALELQLVRDDGAVVYLNGTEVTRSNMPTGTVSSSTLASSSVGGAAESAVHTFAVDPALLVAGTNVIAVELHQANTSTSDASFDLALVPTSGPTPNPDPPPGGEVTYTSPIVITQGGTYTGNWESTDFNTPAVLVNTTEPVVIENANVRGKGDLIRTGVDNTDITVRNTRGYGVNPNIRGEATGRFFYAEFFQRATGEQLPPGHRRHQAAGVPRQRVGRRRGQDPPQLRAQHRRPQERRQRRVPHVQRAHAGRWRHRGERLRDPAVRPARQGAERPGHRDRLEPDH